MKKHLLLICSIILSQFCIAADKPVTAPEDIPAYYADANGKSGDELWTTISAITNTGYSAVSYNNLFNAYLKTDVYPEDSVDKAGQIWDIFGECSFQTGDQCGNYTATCDCYNRGFLIQKSWFGGSTTAIGSDLFHVIPNDGYISGRRSLYPFGETNDQTE